MADDPCTRCGQTTGFRPTRFHYWLTYVLDMRAQVARRHILRLIRARDHGWHAETSSETIDAKFSELTLCNDCALAIWDYAQGGFWKIPGRAKPGDRIAEPDLATILDTAPEGTVIRLPDTTEATMRHARYQYPWRADDDNVYTSAQLAHATPLTIVSIGQSPHGARGSGSG